MIRSGSSCSAREAVSIPPICARERMMPQGKYAGDAWSASRSGEWARFLTGRRFCAYPRRCWGEVRRVMTPANRHAMVLQAFLSSPGRMPGNGRWIPHERANSRSVGLAACPKSKSITTLGERKPLPGCWASALGGDCTVLLRAPIG